MQNKSSKQSCPLTLLYVFTTIVGALYYFQLLTGKAVVFTNEALYFFRVYLVYPASFSIAAIYYFKCFCKNNWYKKQVQTHYTRKWTKLIGELAFIWALSLVPYSAVKHIILIQVSFTANTPSKLIVDEYFTTSSPRSSCSYRLYPKSPAWMSSVCVFAPIPNIDRDKLEERKKSHSLCLKGKSGQYGMIIESISFIEKNKNNRAESLC